MHMSTSNLWKNLTAVLMVAVMLFFLTPPFAEDVSAASGSVAQGQQVEIVVKIMTANKYDYTLLICYDIDAFTMDDSSLEVLVGPKNGTWITPYYNGTDPVRKDMPASVFGGYHPSVLGKSGSQVLAKYASKDFVKEERPAAGTDIFKCRLTALKAVDINDDSFFVGTNVGATNYEISSVTILGGGGSSGPELPAQTDAAYTITPTADGASFDETFNVNVKLTANPPESKYASAQAELTYNPLFVTPILTGLANVSEKTPETPGTLTVTHGPGQDQEVGANGALLATIPFAPTADGAATFAVSDNATVSLGGGDENTQGIPAAPGASLIVNVTVAQEPAVTFDADYAGLPAGHKLLRYELEAAPTNFHTYGGENMHYAQIEGKHYLTYIVADTLTAETALTPVLTDIPYVNDGDLNGSGLRISDAQIAYDVAHGHDNYKALDGLGIQARLKADVNGDGAVTQADADAIVYAIHHGGSLPSE